MPNNRNRNNKRNKNKNKNRNKQNNNNNQPNKSKDQQEQSDQQQQEQREEFETDNQAAETVATLQEPAICKQTDNITVTSQNQNVNNENVKNVPGSHNDTKSIAHIHMTTETAIASKAVEKITQKDIEIAAEEVEVEKPTTESGTESKQEPHHTMGANNTKGDTVDAPPEKSIALPDVPDSPRQAKVIVHRIVTNDYRQEHQHQHQETQPTKSPPLQRSARVIIHTLHVESDSTKTKSPGKPPAIEAISDDVSSTGTLSPPPRYTVESPKNHADTSLADFESLVRDIQIQELSQSNSGEFAISDNTPLVSEVESDTEQVKSPNKDTDGLTLLQRAEDEILDATVAISKSQQDELKMKRAQKRSALETHFLPQLLSPRYLDSILEENSDLGSEFSLSRSSTTNIDERMEEATRQVRNVMESFPKSQLNFTRSHKPMQKQPAYLAGHAISEEPVPLVLEAKLVDQVIFPREAFTRVASTLVPESEDAELVYLSSSASSSMSDLMELELEKAASLAERTLVDLDTDANALITKPPTQLTSSSTSASSVPSTATSVTAVECESRESTPVNPIFSASDNSCFSLSAKVAQQISTSTATPLPPTTTTTPPTQPMSAAKNEVSKFEGESKFSAIAGTKSAIADDVAKHFENILSANENITTADSFSLSVAGNNAKTSPPSTSSVSNSSISEVTEFLIAIDKMREFVETSKPKEKVVYANGMRDSPSPPPIPPPPHASVYDLQMAPPQLYSTKIVPTKTTIAGQKANNQQTLAIATHTQTTDSKNTNSDNNTNTNTILPTTSKNNQDLLLKRQESADSYCSDSTQYSQCTAIQVASPPPSLTPTLFSSQLINQPTQSQFDESQPFSDAADSKTDPLTIKKLRLLCTETLASMPYGEDVLVELAHVAQNINEVRAKHKQEEGDKMPFPLPDLPHINDLQLSLADNSPPTIKKAISTNHVTFGGDVPAHTVAITQLPPSQLSKFSTSLPTPPVTVPPPLSKYEEANIDKLTTAPNVANSWLGLPTSVDPKLLICLSPAQHSLINEQQSTEFNKPDQLLDAHKKFIERRGYHELSADQVRAINNEKLEEQQILKTAAIMKQLRKGLTPSPPPVPPPPVPVKSSETVAKANSARQREDANSSALNDVIARNANKTTATAKAMENGNQNNNNNNDINNRHRLLEILQNDDNVFRNELHTNKPFGPTTKATATATAKTSASLSSSYENNSRQTADEQRQKQEPPALPQRSFAKTEQTTEHRKHFTSSSSKSTTCASNQDMDATTKTTRSSFMSSPKFPESTYLQGVENGLFRMFPSIGKTDIFEGDRKRFSNIESSFTGNQNLQAKPKRFSNIETSSFESKKRIENGQTVYDYSNRSHEKTEEDGEMADRSSYLSNEGQSGGRTMNIPIAKDLSFKDETDCKSTTSPPPPPVPPSPAPELFANVSDEEQKIMSALKLNAHNTTETNVNKTEQCENSANINRLNESKQEKITSFKENISNTYEEFRQNAKVATEEAASTSGTNAEIDVGASEAKPPSTANFNKATFATTPTTTNGSTRHFIDHEKLFKDFDDLSKQLHIELESGKAQREEREKSASLYDLSRLQLGSKQFDELKQARHEHMQELEREIERSRRARKERVSVPRSYEIPIQLEYNQSHSENNNEISTNSQSHTKDSQRDYRRAESMCNLTNPRPHTTLGHYGSQYFAQKPQEDDWERYASDLGYSENIAKPFAREVEICYQRQNQRPSQPHGIRAPRLSVSTNDLSTSTLHSFDTYNAYGARRSHAPMLSQAPQQQRPHYTSCYSMIERNPNPTYISTTSRRGVSPAPQPQPQPQSQRPQPQRPQYERRASLPRELHDQQLKYISSKEEELQMEFDRLQNERRRLMDEMNRAAHQQIVTPSQRRDNFRPGLPKLPTLTEDEVFRQQMAEEWLNKVAEREERRLQKIIKISKIHNDEHVASLVAGKSNISDEFLNRVKERRTKLSIPADSDWESGAESQPYVQGQASESDAEAQPMKIIEGKSEVNIRQLPRHLREFAKLSNHETQQLDGGQREIHEEEQFRQEANDNSLSSAQQKSSFIKTFKMSRLPPSVQKPNINQGELTATSKKSIALSKDGAQNRHYSRSNTTQIDCENLNASAFVTSCSSTRAKNANNTSSLPNANSNSTPTSEVSSCDIVSCSEESSATRLSQIMPSSCNNITNSDQNPPGAGNILGTALLVGLSILTAWNKLC